MLLAAINRPEILDPALLRAGRSDRQVLVDRPDLIGRAAILRVHAKEVKLAEGIDLDVIAALTPGFTGADLANLVNEAALRATRRGADAVSTDDFTGAVERIVAGIEKPSRLLNPHEREVVAYHEMGHAIVATALPGTDPVHKVSMIPRSVGALGYTMQRPTEDRFLLSRGDLENRLAVILRGRAAEMLVFNRGIPRSGRRSEQGDRHCTRHGGALRHARQARSRNLRDAAPDIPRRNAFAHFAEPEFREDTAREIDCAGRELTTGAFEKALGILRKYCS